MFVLLSVLFVVALYTMFFAWWLLFLAYIHPIVMGSALQQQNSLESSEPKSGFLGRWLKSRNERKALEAELRLKQEKAIKDIKQEQAQEKMEFKYKLEDNEDAARAQKKADKKARKRQAKMAKLHAKNGASSAANH